MLENPQLRAHEPESGPSTGLPLAPIARNLGLFGLLRRMRRRELLVLAVHGVVPPRHKLPWQPLRDQVDVVDFETQIDCFQRTHTFVDLAGAQRVLAGETTERNPVLLTFDDGYRNNLDIALPVLKARGIRPLIFLTTAYLDNADVFWFDRFDYAIQQITTPWLIDVDERRFMFKPDDRRAMKATYAALRSHAKQQGWDDGKFHDLFSHWCDELEHTTGKRLAAVQPTDPWSSTLSHSQIRTAVHRGDVDVGSHTLDHMRIDKLTAPERMRQLVESKQLIEAIIDRECDSFCYPNGDWDTSSALAVAQAGYRMAFTTDTGFNRAGDDAYTLKRQFLPTHSDENYLEALGAGAISAKERFNHLLSASP